jgi:hypothetical protein
MSPQQSQYTARDSDPTGDDQSVCEAQRSAAIAQLIERPESEPSAQQPLDIVPPTDWPPCPDCDGRLMATAVATDAQETLVAAVMTCDNSTHATKRYVYDVGAETLSREQGLSTGEGDEADESRRTNAE